MCELTELKSILLNSQKKYQDAQKKLEVSLGDQVAFPAAAQQANDAWLEYKKADIAFNNFNITKTIGDLYGG